MKKSINNLLDISIVIPMHNSASTIVETLKGIAKQDYPIKETIIVDNASTDNCVELVKEFAKRHKNLHIKLFVNEKNLFIARSLIRGVSKVKTNYIVFIQSDCRLVGKSELEKLLVPYLKDSSVVATYGRIDQTLETWDSYSFWEKFLFAFQAGKTSVGLVGKIDSIRKDAYDKIGGHDPILCDQYGSEDADIHMRLKEIGKTVETAAAVEHLHYTYSDFSFMDLMRKKRIIAGAYGIMLGRYGFKYEPLGIFTGLIKPALAIGLLIPQTRVIALVLIILFISQYYWRMFITPSVNSNPRIILIPFVFILLLYLETFWTFEAIFHSFGIKRPEGNKNL